MVMHFIQLEKTTTLTETFKIKNKKNYLYKNGFMTSTWFKIEENVAISN